MESQTVKVNVCINKYTGVVKGEFGNNYAFPLGKGCEERQKEFQFCGLQMKRWILMLLEQHPHTYWCSVTKNALSLPPHRGQDEKAYLAYAEALRYSVLLFLSSDLEKREPIITLNSWHQFR